MQSNPQNTLNFPRKAPSYLKSFVRIWESIQKHPILSRVDNQPTRDLFEFISQEHSESSDLGLFSLLPQPHGEDYEEEQFANRMMKKKKGRKL